MRRHPTRCGWSPSTTSSSARRGGRASECLHNGTPCSLGSRRAGAELIVGGHVHQGSIAERHEFEVTDDAATAVVTTAPGLGQPRPHRLGEARGALAYRVEASAISVDTYIWLADDWELTATRTFPRALGPAVRA